MPQPVRLTPTMRVAVVMLVRSRGSPEIETPSGITPPLSVPFGPVPRAGEPGSRLNQSRITWASSQVVKWVSDTCGMCLSMGSRTALPLPGPFHGIGRMLLLKVTVVCVAS